MPREMAIDGVLIPGLLVWFLISLLLLFLIDMVIGRFGLYRYVWHPALFRLGLIACIFGSIALLLY